MSKPVERNVATDVLAFVLRPAIDLLLSRKWHNREKLPRGEGVIIVANHVTEIDPIVVGHFLYSNGIKPHFLAKTSLFQVPVVGALLKAARQVPVERGGNGGKQSLTVAEEVLAAGGGIVVYPEGTLTRDPELWPMRGRTGAARLALQTGAPVIPVAHWGAQELLPRYAKRIHPFPRKTVHVTVGERVDLSAYANGSVDKENLLAATNVIMDSLSALVGQLRGEEPPASRWDPLAHNQSSTGRRIENTTDGGNEAEASP